MKSQNARNSAWAGLIALWRDVKVSFLPWNLPSNFGLPFQLGGLPAAKWTLSLEGSVLMPGVRVGRGAVVRHAILDKNVVVGPGEMVGVDLEKDRERFAVSSGGVVAVGKGVWI